MENEVRGWKINLNIQNLKYLDGKSMHFSVCVALTQEHHERKRNETLQTLLDYNGN